MFYTIEKEISAELIEKKSKFIADLFPVQNQEEAEEKIKEIKKKYYDAKHHCFSYITFDNEGNKVERCSDDGEPSRNSRSTNARVIKSKELMPSIGGGNKILWWNFTWNRWACKSLCRGNQTSIRTSKLYRKKAGKRGTNLFNL